jgi:hypothetical protein
LSGSVIRNLYVDGRLDNTASGFTFGTATINTRQIGGDTGDLPLNAQLDDIRIYNRALSPSEIKQLYEGGPGFGLRLERKRSRFQVQGFNFGRYRRQQLIGSGVY